VPFAGHPNVGTAFAMARLMADRGAQIPDQFVFEEEAGPCSDFAEAHQIHRTLGITYKSAWFLMHRIREAMTDSDPTPLGGEGKTVEVDETFYGIKGEGPKWILHPQFGWQRVRAGADMMKFVTLVERGGSARLGRRSDREDASNRRAQ
jgi:hypothetical protein